MYSDLLILQLHQCPNLSGTSLSMWACVSWWLGELGKQRTDHTKITQTGYPAYALSIKMDTEKKTKKQWAWNWQANTYATANRQSDLSFGMSFVFTLTWPLSFIDIKCQAFSTDTEDEEERLLHVRESQSHK